MITTNIVFPAVVKGLQFTTQIVSVGGVFPTIEIESVDQSSGLHYFKIKKVLPNYGERMVASLVAESEMQLDPFVNILSYVASVNIKLTGQVFYEINGNLREFNPRPSQTRAVGELVMSGPWSQELTAEFHKNYNYELLKRFTYATAIEEPIGKFISLYALLASLCGDRQAEIDKLIESVEPNVGKSLSPKTGQPESTFTRLRNELAHHRAGIFVVETHRNIGLHLPRFEWIVRSIVAGRIEL